MEIKVFCQFERSRFKVGSLRRLDGEFCFSYHPSWLVYPRNLPLGPDLPLHTKEYRSSKLFSSFERRIPPRNSENYAHYAKISGISVAEQDPMILLGTVAHMGASSFVFELDYSEERQERVLAILQDLVENLSYEIVSAGFGVNKTGLFKLLKKKIRPESSNIYDVLEVCLYNSEAALWRIKTSLFLPDDMKRQLIDTLMKALKKSPA